MAKQSKNVETAQAFAKFVTNAENQKAFAEIVSVFPSTTASADDPFFTKDDGTAASRARVLAFESLKTAQSLNPVQLNGAMSTILTQQIALALRGDITATAALDAAVKQINQMYENQR